MIGVPLPLVHIPFARQESSALSTGIHIQNDSAHESLKSVPFMDKTKQKCVSRESNAGPIDGNDGFYH